MHLPNFAAKFWQGCKKGAEPAALLDKAPQNYYTINKEGAARMVSSLRLDQ